MPAKVPNPRKQFLFTIILPGLNPFMAQDVKLPDKEFEVVEHGDTNFDVKTAGKIKFSNLTVNRIFSAVAVDTYMEDWARRIQNTILGGGQIPSAYKVQAIVEEYGSDGITILRTHIYSGVWPSKINGIELSRKGSDNTVQSLEFCVDEVI